MLKFTQVCDFDINGRIRWDISNSSGEDIRRIWQLLQQTCHLATVYSLLECSASLFLFLYLSYDDSIHHATLESYYTNSIIKWECVAELFYSPVLARDNEFLCKSRA
jgi:hypothetical protein